MSWYRWDGEDLELRVRVQPRAPKDAFVEPDPSGDYYRIRLKAPPVEGKANQALRRFIADAFDVTLSQVEILESLREFPSSLPAVRESAYAAWVSISVGCNNSCTFCIVPSLRGREIDRSPEDIRAEVQALARRLVQAVRASRHAQGTIDAFMQEYSLSSEEGVVLMCLAEALLRIPDAETADKLIADKIGNKDWAGHLGQSDSLFVNASAWGLMLTGRIVELGQGTRHDPTGFMKKLVTRSGEPFIRQAHGHFRILRVYDQVHG